jgi:hypothetical protein
MRAAYLWMHFAGHFHCCQNFVDSARLTLGEVTMVRCDPLCLNHVRLMGFSSITVFELKANILCLAQRLPHWLKEVNRTHKITTASESCRMGYLQFKHSFGAKPQCKVVNVSCAEVTSSTGGKRFNEKQCCFSHVFSYWSVTNPYKIKHLHCFLLNKYTKLISYFEKKKTGNIKL